MSESRKQWIVVGAVLALLAALVGVGWANRGSFLPLDVGSEAPGFRAADLQGRPVALADLRGQVVLLNIWATWCGPCRDEMPSLQRLHQQLGPEGLQVIAVSVDAAPGKRDAGGNPGGDVAAFGKQYGLTFALWREPTGSIQRAYRTTGIPESFVIGRDGSIRKKVIGATEWDDQANVDLIRRLLKQ
ncbi:MAG TPA: TlpA disulfide reductase family protein [Longimicrobium sp.]|jgi:peroxiredoxin